MGRCPALRSRSGVHRQAIPGLTLDASASCLAPRQQARAHIAPALRCSAQTTGGTSEAQSKAHQQHLVIPAKAGIQGSKLHTPLPTPPPSPLPQGEGGLKAGSGDVFDFAFDVAVAVSFDVPPSGCAEHRSLRRTGPRVDAGRGRMPKISPTGHGWPVGETRRGREAQGTESSPSDDSAQTPGRRFLVTSCRCRQEVTRRRRKTSLRRKEDTARAQARTQKLQSQTATATASDQRNSRPTASPAAPPGSCKRLTTYNGRCFDSMKIRPTYSPSTPMLSRLIPPKNITATISEA